MDFISAIQTFPLYVGAFIVALSIIVFVHEMGHYLLGRWTGIRAEVFSIGFGRPLMSFYDHSGTRWQIALIPLGGYVKFLGDSDAASGKQAEFFDELDDETRRSTMHGAPLYARALTVLGGPVFNFILAALVYAGLFMAQGEATGRPTIGALVDGPFDVSELQAGDQITAINGAPIDDYEDLSALMEEIPSTATADYSILRDGQLAKVTGPYPFPPRISLVVPQSAAFDAGIKLDDYIFAVDGTVVHAFNDIVETVKQTKDKPLDLTVWRDGQMLSFNLVPRLVDMESRTGGFESRYLIGLQGGGLFFEPQTQMAHPLDALQFGVESTVNTITRTISMLYHVITGQIDSCNVRGPLTIAETSGATAQQGVFVFISFIAALSVAIGFVNLMPVPVLDGGHLMFHIFEALSGRPPSDRALNVMMTVGLVAVASLMLFALSNDIRCR